MSMISEFVEKLIEKFKDGAFRVNASDLSFINLDRAIRIVNQLAEEYKDVPDTNVGKNLSENLIERLEEERNKQIKPHGGTTIVSAGIMIGLDIAIEIVNQLTEEFGGDINVGSKDAELIEKIKFGIEASNVNDDYTIGLRNGMRYCLALIDGKDPKFESCKQGWIPVSERLPESTDPVNITWVNHKPSPYYKDIKDKPFTATGCYCDGKWYWYSAVCQAYLDEYRYSENDYMDNGIEVIAWMPLPEPYKGE